MDVWKLIAERKIQEAIEEGAFDDLEGAGEPLDLSEDPFVDPADRMAYRLLKNNGFAPDWIEEAKELEAEARRLRAEGIMPKGSYQDRVAALNHRIELFNLKAPSVRLHKRQFDR
jgi:hypothetical protein